jgi:hypothetical protein
MHVPACEGLVTPAQEWDAAGMPDQYLPAELQEFLARYIDSIAQLEGLLLLRGAPD